MKLAIFISINIKIWTLLKNSQVVKFENKVYLDILGVKRELLKQMTNQFKNKMIITNYIHILMYKQCTLMTFIYSISSNILQNDWTPYFEFFSYFGYFYFWKMIRLLY